MAALGAYLCRRRKRLGVKGEVVGFPEPEKREDTSLCDSLEHRRTRARNIDKENLDCATPSAQESQDHPRKSEPRLRRKDQPFPKDLVEDGVQEEGGVARAWRKNLGLKTAYLSMLKTSVSSLS